ncbi:hypothetical protein F0562_014136 [Nyssa sinensis]|uniref:Uncharacterized protein n=1 Tax=Nyssa sinensis TaxID=561372 RepID=A0A5J4ZQ19_9ASTE|nr:hypothetical protein F0562_014136 [Nyssa sinensis]
MDLLMTVQMGTITTGSPQVQSGDYGIGCGCVVKGIEDGFGFVCASGRRDGRRSGGGVMGGDGRREGEARGGGRKEKEGYSCGAADGWV